MARPRRSAFKWINAPPRRAMRRQSAQSAPRLYEWLIDNGYIEPISVAGGGKKRRR